MCVFLRLFFIVLFSGCSQVVQGQAGIIDNTNNYNGLLLNTNNGPELPIQYNQPYFSNYPVPMNNMQGYYYPVPYNNIQKRQFNGYNNQQQFHGYNNQQNLPREFYPGGNQAGGDQRFGDPYPHIKADFIDVDPEYHRQMLKPMIGELGPTDGPTKYQRTGGHGPEIHHHRRPTHYTVKTSGSTSNYTNVPEQYNKPVVTKNSYSTTIRRTFVNDPSKPQEPINLNFLNGVQVNTEKPDEVTSPVTEAETTTINVEELRITTTENADPEDNNNTLQGRRFFDVPKTCPSGTKIGHNGQCFEPFRLGFPLPVSQDNGETQNSTTTEATTTAPNEE